MGDTPEQNRLYQRWAVGGWAVTIIGEVQGTSHFAEKPGDLVLNENSDPETCHGLAVRGGENGALLWLQLDHAGALSYVPIRTPKGSRSLGFPGLRCTGMTLDDIRLVPFEFANTAKLAQQAGFGGVKIHAAHGFLLSRFLSPMFNERSDGYGGAFTNR